MKTLRLIGFTKGGMRAFKRDVVCRFVEWDSTWEDLRGIALDLVEGTSYYLHPEILGMSGPIDELNVLDKPEENWSYAVAVGATSLSLEAWAKYMETKPIAVFEYEN